MKLQRVKLDILRKLVSMQGGDKYEKNRFNRTKIWKTHRFKRGQWTNTAEWQTNKNMDM